MLTTLEETIAMINEGRLLHIAGDDSLLKKLPKGKWIGGTTPYFMSEEGGIFTKEKLFVTKLDFALDFKVALYGKYNIFQTVEECYDNGITLLLMPFGSPVVERYAKEAPEIEELLMHPIAGWVTGFDFNEPSEAKVYDGTDAVSYTDKAVAMYLKLPEGKSAMINLVNIFTDDKDDPVISFHDTERIVSKCTINGEVTDLAQYIEKNGIDIKLPLVADYNGDYINTSVMGVENGAVTFYAPVFRNVEYRFARKIEDYSEEFKKKVDAAGARKPVFSCNCIMNYLHGNLEGQKTPPFLGPVSFGEIAYQLLNQTMVYFEILE